LDLPRAAAEVVAAQAAWQAVKPVATLAAARVALPVVTLAVAQVGSLAAVLAARPEVERVALRADAAALQAGGAAAAVAKLDASCGCRRPRGTVNPRSSSHFPSPKRRVPCAALPD